MAYHVFSRLTIDIMTVGDITCDLYAAIAFNTASLSNTWTLCLDFVLGNYSKSCYSVMCYLTMIFCSIYIIVFPTLVSAMTSYGAISHAVVSDGIVSVPFEDWASIDKLFLLDGHRVGKPDSWVVSEDQDYNFTSHVKQCTFFSLLSTLLD